MEAPRGVELHGPRLRLRDFRETDRDDVHAFAGDPEVTRFTDWGPNTPEQTETFLDEVRAAAAARPRLRYGLAIETDDGDGAAPVIGSAELLVDDARPGTAAVGYVLRRDRWGFGYATEATGLLLAFGFGELRLARIEATCAPENITSARVLEKAGLRLERRVPRALHVRGAWRDSLVFAVTHPDE